MALAKGIAVQPSRFSALNIESDSDSDPSDNNWFEVVSGGKGAKSKGKAAGDAAARAHTQQQQNKDGPAGARPLSKSAKKRARKKRNQQSSSESKGATETTEVQEGLDGDAATLSQEMKQWQEKEAEAADLEFQRELEEALLQSKLTAEQEQEIEKQRKAAALLKKQSKKGVKLSLQSLHRGDVALASDVTESPKALNDDSAFFERLGQDVDSEVKKRTERKISESQMSPVEESARVAHVMDELEKRDNTIADLRKDKESLQSQMKEVRGRNQQLCKILGRGEFSTKTQLLEQLEELTTVKNELMVEVQSLHVQLEQERSRNKTLQAELTKYTSKTRKNSHH